MTIFKRTKALIAMTILTAMTLTLTACGGGDSVGKFIFATGGTSGTYYPLGGAIANTVNAKAPNTNIVIQATGASKENIKLLSKGEADYAIVQNDVMDYAMQGTELFEGDKVTGLKSVCAIYPEIVQIVVAVDSGINSVADLKGKNVSTGDAGSGVEANAIQILAAYGLTVDDIKVNHLSFKESGTAFKDGQLDAFFVTAGIPNTAIVELAVTRPVKLLNVDGAELQALQGKFPFYSEITIPKDVYKTETDINTVAVKAMIATNDKMSEDDVYNFVKAMYENLDAIGAAHAKGKEIMLDTAASDMTVELHAGAAKYFKEVGIIS